MRSLYYTPPDKQIFEEVKRASVRIWKSYDNVNGHLDSKIKHIEELRNIADNFMYMVAMFDIQNQTRLASMLSNSARLAIRQRLVASGAVDYFIVF